MRKLRVFALLMVAFAVLVVTRPAHAGCYSYEPGNDVPCFGSNGWRVARPAEIVFCLHYLHGGCPVLRALCEGRVSLPPTAWALVVSCQVLAKGDLSPTLVDEHRSGFIQ